MEIIVSPKKRIVTIKIPFGDEVIRQIYKNGKIVFRTTSHRKLKRQNSRGVLTKGIPDMQIAYEFEVE